jgi:hypothetical protein
MSDCCSENKCCCPCHAKQEECSSGENGEMFGKYFIELADCAWEEVLKEEMKEYIRSSQKGRMKELAKIVAEANNKRWRHKMEKKQCCAEFQEDLCDFFSKSKK